MTTELNRRHTLAGVAVVGVGAPLLAACGADQDETATDQSSAAGSSDEPTSPGSEPAAAGALALTSDIEVGGGTIFADQKVVVTQPSEGDFRAFSSACTHQGCQVNGVSEGGIVCPCHGSVFSIEDGSVQAGPAESPLPEVEIAVDGDQITLA